MFSHMLVHTIDAAPENRKADTIVIPPNQYKTWQQRGAYSIQRFASGVLQNVEAAGFAVDGVDQAVLIDNGVIDGDGVGGVIGWRRWNEEADFFDAWWGVCNSGNVDQAKDADSTVEESCYRGVLQLCRGGAGEIGTQIMRAITPAAFTEFGGVSCEWSGADNHGIGFGANVYQPHEFGRIGASVLDGFIGDKREAAVE
jgi:hypothetical protein